jgi:hypothetical protein
LVVDRFTMAPLLMAIHPLTEWHQIVRTRDASRLAALLADDVVFHSPVVHTPQVGKAITTKYDAVLEFRVEIDGISVNGVDMLTWNEAGQLVEFKVMLRPLKAVQLIHQKMATLLQENAR